MKAIIAPYTHDYAWCEEFFLELSLCSLPLAGRSAAEHLLDLSSLLGVTKLHILDYTFNQALHEKLQNCEQYWSTSFDYLGSAAPSSLNELRHWHKAFFAQDEVLVFLGPVLPILDSHEEFLTQFVPCPEGKYARDGIFLVKPDGSITRYQGPQMTIASPADYFDINFKLLQHPGCYNLPGYSAENGVHTGMNVVIKQNCVIHSPVMLLDDICLERDCTLTNGVIVGSNSIVDRHTLLDHAIVLDGTYLGQDMEIKDKIVVGQRIIDPFAGVFVDQSDVGVSANMHQVKRFTWLRLGEILVMLLLVLMLLPVYVLALPFWPFFHRRIWWRKLSLDRYPQLWRVLLRGGYLVRRTMKSDEPFVFCASELTSTNASEAQQNLDDMFFCHHISLMLMLRIMLHGTICRLFATHDRSH